MLFFFKQKTTYEMRISDWSSDVCSSDLAGPRHAAVDGPQPRVRGAGRGGHPRAFDADQVQPPGGAVRADDGQRQRRAAPGGSRMSTPHADMSAASDARRNWTRSEEHTSELQSLMRNSYAVFCWNKKKNQ